MGKIVKAAVGIAVVVAIAVVAPYLAPALVGATASAATIAAATAAISIVLSVAAGMLLAAVFPPPRASGTAAPTNFRQSVANSYIVYGKRRVGGLIVFFHARKGSLAFIKRHYRYFVIACAGHRCKGVVTWMLNDEKVTVDGGGKVTSGKYANHAWLWFQRGTADQAANATFVAECEGRWTANHRGRGVAAIYAKFEMSDDVVEAGMPSITAVIEGRDEVRDPRTGEVGYTRLATPIFYDWLALPREEGGFGASADEIPDDAILSAWTNICAESVALEDGTSEERYCFDSVIMTGAAPSEVRQTFLTCCAGTFTYSTGVFLMRPGYWNPPSASLSEDDLAGPITVPVLGAPEGIATEASGTFIDPATNYQPGPVPTRSVLAANVRQMDVDLPHITSITSAQRIVEIMLRRAQCEKRVTWPMNIAGLKVQAIDTVQLDTARYGLSNYAWVVDGWGMSQDFGVVLQCREENEDIYAPIDYLLPGEIPTLAVAEPIITPPAGYEANMIATSYTAGLAGNLTQTVVGGAVKVTVPDHQRIYADGTVEVDGADVTGLAIETDYLIFYDDLERAGGAVTFQVTTVAIDAYFSAAHPGRHFVGFVTTQAADGSGGVEGGSGPPGSGGWGGVTPPGGGGGGGYPPPNIP